MDPRLPLLMIAALLVGCGTRTMGQSCSSSQACAGDGVCLAGVCTGYDCASDTDCTGGLICGSVLGVRACMTACGDDGDCPGEQSCREVQLMTEGDERALYCM